MPLPRLRISSCRAYPVTVRAIHRHKETYPTLFNDLKESQRTGYWDAYEAIRLSEQGQTEYLDMVENILAVKKVPNSNRYVAITTHDGGRFMGFYEDGKWQYHNLDKKAILVNGVIIQWESLKANDRKNSCIKKWGNKKKRDAFFRGEDLTQPRKARVSTSTSRESVNLPRWNELTQINQTRKPHTCSATGKEIQQGSSCWKFVGIFEGDFQSWYLSNEAKAFLDANPQLFTDPEGYYCEDIGNHMREAEKLHA